MQKKCKMCDNKFDLSEFANNRSHSDGKSSYCKECNSRRMREHYLKHPEIKQRQVDRATRKRNELRAIVDAVKAQYGCCICSENEPACLDFHHLDSTTKEKTISLLTNSKSVDKIKTEMLKCCILCANCHRKHHAGKIEITNPTQWDSLVSVSL